MEYAKLGPGNEAVNNLSEGGPEQPRRFYEMCMVFKSKPHKGVKDPVADNMNDMPGLRDGTADELQKMEMWRQRREAILKSMQNVGLQLFCYYSRDRDAILVKIGAPAQKLRETAARMKYKLQLKSQYLGAYAEYRHDFPGTPERHHKDRRIVSHLYKTHTDDDFADSDSIFKSSDKINLIHRIITSKDKDCAGINVGKLLHEGELQAYFPLHDSMALAEIRENKLQWFLMPEEFAQRLHSYFGDRIAFYFVFMSFYWKWLFPLAFIGIVVQFIDAIVGTPDNITAIPFCILVSVWCTCLPYFWRRQEAKFAIGWGSFDLVETLEPCRPEHYGDPRINPVTAQVEPFFPWRKRLAYYVQSCFVMGFFGVATVLVICYLLLLRHQMLDLTSVKLWFFQIFLVAVVEVLNAVLSKIARCLTTRENHRTWTENETHMLAKTLLFKFVNSYFILYWTAFFKAHKYLFTTRMQCWHDDCFVDLSWQLATFVFFRLTVLNALEYVRPKVALWWRSLVVERRTFGTMLQLALSGRTARDLADMSAAEQQSKKDRYDAFHNFDEILLSHGLATFFVVSAPWVCMAILVSTLVEIFVDMRSLMDSQQRRIPYPCRSNEPWNTAFDIFGVIAASTNIILLVFTSELYSSWTMTEKLVLFIYLEHMILLARLATKAVFPAVPRNVELLQLKQEHMVYRCLENIKVEEDRDYGMFRDRSVEQVEIFENDIFERDDDVEPEFDFWESGKAMLHGMKDESVKICSREAE